jgi:excisionase family DNA binding protein
MVRNSVNEDTVEELWDARDVAAYLKLSRSWVYQASAAGVLPSVRFGSRLRFHPDVIRAWARGERTPSPIALPGCRG